MPIFLPERFEAAAVQVLHLGYLDRHVASARSRPEPDAARAREPTRRPAPYVSFNLGSEYLRLGHWPAAAVSFRRGLGGGVRRRGMAVDRVRADARAADRARASRMRPDAARRARSWSRRSSGFPATPISSSSSRFARSRWVTATTLNGYSSAASSSARLHRPLPPPSAWAPGSPQATLTRLRQAGLPISKLQVEVKNCLNLSIIPSSETSDQHS